MSSHETTDLIWKALADPTRRRVLDVLREGPATTGQLVQEFPELTRFGVMKHLEVLVEANLVLIRREGRERWNHLNPLPIQEVCNRWISPYMQETSNRLLRLKKLAEAQSKQSGNKTRPKRRKSK